MKFHLAWNTSSKQYKENGSDKDPWSGKSRNEQGPPDLSKLFNDFQQKIRGALGKKGSPSGGNPPPNSTALWMSASLAAIIILALWLVAGFYIVAPAEKAVVLRFGKFLEVQGPGPHWAPYFIDTRTLVNVEKVSNYHYEASMLTKDENIVKVALAVQYRIDDPKLYLYNVVAPTKSLQQATASALRQVIGDTNLDKVLTSGRKLVSFQVDHDLKKILKSYQTGLQIVGVALQSAKPPEEVTDAFDDAIKAREDEVRYKRHATAYANRVMPIAEGQASRILQEAKAYQEQVVLNAQGQIAEFMGLLPIYQRYPQVTRERMYIETVESMLQRSTKILAEGKNNQNLMYLPLDKLFKGSSEKAAAMKEEGPQQADGSKISSPRNNSHEVKVSRGAYQRSDFARSGETS